MPEPILAIDFGTSTSAAVLVTGDGEQLITERSGNGQTWPSVVCFDGATLRVGTEAENLKRRHADQYRAEFKLELGRSETVQLGSQPFPVLELITRLLAEMRAAAERAAGEPVTRAVLTIPASYDQHDVRRALMIEAATEAGFALVELLPEPVAAAFAPAAGPPFPAGSLILVYDLGGGTFDTALVRIGRGAGSSQAGNEVLGHAAIGHGSGGMDIDAALYDDLLKSAGPPLTDLVTTRRARLQLIAQTEKLKQLLTETSPAGDYFGDSDVLLSVTRDRLEELAAPVLERTIDCVATMLTATSTALDEVTEVLLVGGVTQMPLVARTLEAAFDRPVRPARAPQLAVVQGAARFAAAASARFAVPAARRVTERPLRWSIPGGSATLLRWRVQVGDKFGAGAVLADVRLAAGAIWELRAARRGRMQAQHALEGATVVSGDWLVTAGEPSPETALRPVKLSGHHAGYGIHTVAASPDGLKFATGDHYGYALVWEVGNSNRLMQMNRDSSDIHALAFSPNGTRLASSGGPDVMLWELASGNLLSTLTSAGPVTDLSFSPVGPALVTSGADVRIWDLADGSYKELFAGVTDSVRFSPDGTRIASGHPDGKIRIWRADLGNPPAELEHPHPVCCLAFSPDSTRIAVAGPEGLITIRDATTGEPVRSMSHDAHTVTDIAFTADGTMLASAGGSEGRLWDAITGDALASMPHENVCALAFNLDDRLLVTAGQDTYAQTWLVG